MNLRVKAMLSSTLFLLKKSVSFLVLFTYLVTSLPVVSLLAAPLPTTLGYQGYFTNTAGIAQTGTSTMTLRIYDAATSGTLLFEEIENQVPIVNGYFSIAIGSVGDVSATTTAAAISDLTFDQPYYITVELASPYNTGEMTLAPTEQ